MHLQTPLGVIFFWVLNLQESLGKNIPVEGLNEGLNEGLKTILELLANKPGIQAKNISTLLSRPIKSVERQIKSLIDQKLIERRGSKKTGGYWKTEK